MTILFVVPGLLVVAVVALVARIMWLNTIEPYTYEELFVLPDQAFLDARKPYTVEMDGVFNMRDIGGYETAEGRRVKRGLVYRSAFLSELTDADHARFTSLGIQRVYDLRTPKESAERPDKLPEGIAYIPLRIVEEEPMKRLRVFMNRHRLLDIFSASYRGPLLDEGAAKYGQMIRDITDADKLPVLYHCTAGKDRTGIATALILEAVGVPRDTVIKDYLMSNLTADYWLDDMEAQMVENGVEWLKAQQLWPLIATSPRLINDLFEHIDDQHGGVIPFLTNEAGLTGADIERLKDTLLE